MGKAKTTSVTLDPIGGKATGWFDADFANWRELKPT
jgi:hypothetical protein